MKNKKNTDVFMEDQRESMSILLSLPIPDYVKNTPHTGASLNSVGKISLPSVKVMKAIKRNFNNKWLPNIVFYALVLAVSNMSPVSVYSIILCLIRVLNLLDDRSENSISRDSHLELNVGMLDSAFKSIIKSSELTPNAKVEIYNKYMSAARFINAWYESHEASFGFSRDIYKSLVIPLLDSKSIKEDISRLTKKINDNAKTKRKSETDELFPSFKEILAAAHFRLNSYERFYRASKQAEVYILSNGLKEYRYSYYEGECLVFCRLVHVDVLLEGLINAGHDYFLEKSVRNNYEKFIGKNSLDVKNYFVEIENHYELDSNLFWFVELFSAGAFHPPQSQYQEDRERFLKANGFKASHFYTAYLIPAGLGGLSKGFPLIASKALSRIFIPHHDIRIIFNLAALATEFISTTGARINEVAQIAVHPDCIKRITIPKSDSLGHVERYVVMLFPKGSEEQRPYFISDETFRLLNRVTNIEAEHNEIFYGKKELPFVRPAGNNHKLHLMDYKPYSFQVGGMHLGAQSIVTAINLLLHGAITKVAYNGNVKNVAIKAHVLRHAFASFSVNVEKIPVDVVAKILNQKHLPVTKYYSEPTISIISHHQSSIADSMLASIDLGSEVIRLPKELVDLYDDAKNKVGTLTEVIGGTCVSHGFCAARFSCIGCAGKVPDPSKKDVVVRKLQWAIKEKEWCKNKGLSAEIRKMDMLIRDCKREIEEMNVIKAYTEDAERIVKIFDSSKMADKWISDNEP